MSTPTNSTAKLWAQGLLAAIITSVATAGLSALGTNVLGIGLSVKQFLVTCRSAGLVGMRAYLKQSPLPYYDFEGGKIDSSKIVSLLFAFLGLSALTLGGLTGCASHQVTPAQVKSGAIVVSSGVLVSQKDLAAKKSAAKLMHQAAVVIRTLSTGQVLTIEELKDVLTDKLEKHWEDPAFETLVTTVNSLYAAYYPELVKTPGVQERYAKLLIEVADGLDLAAAPYLK